VSTLDLLATALSTILTIYSTVSIQSFDTVGDEDIWPVQNHQQSHWQQCF